MQQERDQMQQLCGRTPLDARCARPNIRRGEYAIAAHVRSLKQPFYHMMMAHDSSTTPPSRLSEETLGAVRVALREYLADQASPAPLQHALLRVASEAREKEMLPEQLLIALKEVWSRLPEVRAIPDTTEQVRLLQRVVTMCIKEYYSA